jgi:hypothetical protein
VSDRYSLVLLFWLLKLPSSGSLLVLGKDLNDHRLFLMSRVLPLRFLFESTTIGRGSILGILLLVLNAVVTVAL